MRKFAAVLGLLGVLPSAEPVAAGVVAPTSYDMPNGDTGSYNYWDDLYNGSGNNTVDGAFLSGGVGDLTDGVIATDNWYVVEAPAGPGPYVGWTVDPVITFRFAAAYEFTSVRIYLDDSDGAGGVSAPSGAIVNGTVYPIADPSGSAPFFVDLALAGPATDTLVVQLVRNNVWVFASEFTFQTGAAAVPEPSGIVLAAVGLLVPSLRLARRRRG